jgi:hypothetical protein
MASVTSGDSCAPAAATTRSTSAPTGGQKLDRIHDAGSDERPDEAVQRIPGTELFAAVRRDHEDPAVAHGMGEKGDEVERRHVRPLQVLEHEDERLGTREVFEHGEHLLEEAEARVVPGLIHLVR